MPESGFRIKNIVMIEASMKREISIGKIDHDNINVAVDVKVSAEKTEVLVVQTLNYKRVCEGKEAVSIQVKMMGVFERIGNPPLGLQEFGEINAAAIIYPYIREQVTNFSTKAALGAIMLPPINFTKKENNNNQ